MNSKYFLFIIILIVTGCNNSDPVKKQVTKSTVLPTPKPEKEFGVKKENSQTSEPKSLTESDNDIASNEVFITEPCAIIINPTTARIDAFRKDLSEEDYDIVLDDNLYYLGKAREILKNRKLKVLETKALNLSFKKKDGSFTKVQIPAPEGLWDIVLFNGESYKTIDLTNPEPEVTAFMK